MDELKPIEKITLKVSEDTKYMEDNRLKARTVTFPLTENEFMIFEILKDHEERLKAIEAIKK